jgi:hypothetical protein
VNESCDLDALVTAMRIRGVSGPEVDRIDSIGAEVGDVGPSLLGLDLEGACGTERLDGGRAGYDSGWRRIAQYLD